MITNDLHYLKRVDVAEESICPVKHARFSHRRIWLKSSWPNCYIMLSRPLTDPSSSKHVNFSGQFRPTSETFKCNRRCWHTSQAFAMTSSDSPFFEPASKTSCFRDFTFTRAVPDNLSDAEKLVVNYSLVVSDSSTCAKFCTKTFGGTCSLVTVPCKFGTISANDLFWVITLQFYLPSHKLSVRNHQP